MMKIIVIGLLYNVLLQSSAAGEAMVKFQICRDFFATATTEALKEIDQLDLRKNFKDIEVKRKGPQGNAHGARGRNRKVQNIRISFTNVQIEDSRRSQILSKNRFETSFNVRVEYGDKGFSQNGRSQNNYIFLNMEVIAVLRFDVTREKFVYYMQDCDVYLRHQENNIPDFDLNPGTVRGPLNSNLCHIVRQMTDIMNEKCNDCLIIDPSGVKKLVLSYISQATPNCLELNFNLIDGDSEVTSEQKHQILKGNRISFLKDFIYNLLSIDVRLKELNKILAEKELQLSPEQLKSLIHDIYETAPINLHITVTQLPLLDLNANGEATIMMKMLAFSPKSDKSFFDVTFDTKVNVDPMLNMDNLNLQFLQSSGKPEIHSWNSNIGQNGNLDYENLRVFIKKFIKDTFLPSLNDLHLYTRIPLVDLGTDITVNQETIEVSP